jgi:hypothetical protein
MNQSHMTEFYEFERCAIEIVRKGQAQSIRGLGRIIQIITLPSLDNVIGWEVCLDSLKSDKPYLILCTNWKKLNDLEKFGSPVEKLKYLNRLSPTIEFHRFELEQSFVESIIHRFKSISIPAFIKSEHFGLDGTSYEVNIGSPWASLQFHWWEQPPRQWQQIGEITFDALEKLNRLLAQSE